MIITLDIIHSLSIEDWKVYELVAVVEEIYVWRNRKTIS